jgi:N-carbamoyl-L-amino-acid hydrolase
VLALAGIPSAMILVRNPSGISHAPEEFAEEDDAERGVVALAAAIRSRLA